MTYRDPLYDANSRPEGSTLEDQIDQKVNDSSSSGGAQAKGEEMKQQGKQAMGHAKDKGGQAAQQAKEKGGEAMDQAKSKASELGGQAHERTDQGLDKASSGLSSAADKLRQQGEQQEGQVGDVASTAAEKIDSASGYLRERDSDQLVNDLEDLVRRKPVESLLAAAGIGLLLSRIFS